MKYRPLRPRRGLRGSRAVIRAHRSWRSWMMGAVLLLAIGVGLAVWAYDAGQRGTQGPSVGGAVTPEPAVQDAELRDALKAVTGERDRLRAGADTAEAELRMARAAQERLAEQLKAAEAESAQLKEDLGFFETLLPATGDTSGVHVRSFRVTRDETQPHALHYRLLVMQGGSRAFVPQPEFQGNLEFTITALRAGKPLTVTAPQSGGPSLPQVRFQHYQRIEGDLAVPPDAEIRAVAVRVVQNGQVRAAQSVSP
ncbi:DUF6776 family protein [Cupriavidus pampae]|uniref:DNA-binding protein n=1 Tax=Cupriavidus pampae TaxID=659251 RepID=A0ABM8WR99_9BURK|nr:DUF6776 family protein [Cupriavidus pampae]CAG9169982.1 hypothetical protein LMG32289_01946 [Cupriavidus pampae]